MPRDRGTWFAVFRAVETLGFYDFSTSLYDYRDGESGTGDRLEADYERWAEQEGESERDRGVAIACRAAFSGSSGDG